MKLNKKVSLLTTTLSALLFSMSSYGASTTLVGTFCFSGTMNQDTGQFIGITTPIASIPCIFKLDIIQNITSYNLNGTQTCNNTYNPSVNIMPANPTTGVLPAPSNYPTGGVQTANSYTNTTTGNGFISGNSFVGWFGNYSISVDISTMIMTVGYQNPYYMSLQYSPTKPQSSVSVATFNNVPCQ